MGAAFDSRVRAASDHAASAGALIERSAKCERCSTWGKSEFGFCKKRDSRVSELCPVSFDGGDASY